MSSFLDPAASDVSVKPKSEKDKLKELFPALCKPNDPSPKVLKAHICVSCITVLISLYVFIETVLSLNECSAFNFFFFTVQLA